MSVELRTEVNLDLVGKNREKQVHAILLGLKTQQSILFNFI